MRKKLAEGLVQVYTGNGKGKTTAALGLALRASGAGLKVCICQFVKGRLYSEIKALKKLKNIKVYQCGRTCFIIGRPGDGDRERARAGLEIAHDIIMSGKCDLIILDEINIALKLRLLKIRDVINMIKEKPRFVEIVLTGRYCPSAICKYADLVTQMREVKHPYRKGIFARRGIEY